MQTPILSELLQGGEAELRRETAALAQEGKELERGIGLAKTLLVEYQKKSSAVSVVFSIATESHWAGNGVEFQDSLDALVKELEDLHRYQVRQKLYHGQLRIPVEESDDPFLDWLGLWCGGYPDPRRIEKWGSSFQEFQERIESRLMVTPTRDITVGGAVKDQKKHVAPRVLRSFLERLPRIRKQVSPKRNLPKKGEWVGFVMNGDEVTETPLLLPTHLKNGYVSGTTDSGKTFTARVLAENAIVSRARLLAIDPTRQWCGLSHPTTNEKALKRLDDLGIGRDKATGFRVRVLLPDAGEDFPRDSRELFEDSTVISVKDLDDLERGRIVRDALRAVYQQMVTESEELKLLVAIEESHCFLPGNVCKGEADEVAKEIRMLVNRIAREKRKYGVSLLLVTQSLADFRGEFRIVREMCNSRFFMRATDKAELDFVERYVSKEAVDTVKNLRPGEALVHGSMVPTVKVLVRPPFSEVREIPIDSLVRVSESPGPDTGSVMLSEEEQELLQTVRSFLRESGQHINFAKAALQLGITSKRKMRDLVDGLLRKGLVRVETRSDRGKPKVIIPLDQMLD